VLFDATEFGVPLLLVTALDATTSSFPVETEEPGCELWEAREEIPKRDAFGPGVDGSAMVPANTTVKLVYVIEPYSRRGHEESLDADLELGP